MSETLNNSKIIQIKYTMIGVDFVFTVNKSFVKMGKQPGVICAITRDQVAHHNGSKCYVVWVEIDKDGKKHQIPYKEVTSSNVEVTYDYGFYFE